MAFLPALGGALVEVGIPVAEALVSFFEVGAVDAAVAEGGFVAAGSEATAVAARGAAGVARAGARLGAEALVNGGEVAADILDQPAVQNFLYDRAAVAAERYAAGLYERAGARVMGAVAEAEGAIGAEAGSVMDYVESGKWLTDFPKWGVIGTGVGAGAAGIGHGLGHYLYGRDSGGPSGGPMSTSSAGSGSGSLHRHKRPRTDYESPFGEGMDVDAPGAPSRKRAASDFGRERGRRRIDYGALLVAPSHIR